MDQKTLQARAQEYIEQEQNSIFRSEIEQLLADDNTAELSDRFYTDLEFGTGGLRGVIGGGFNRMNNLVVSRATEGLARYVMANAGTDSPKAVIGHDSRRYSREFTLQAALVFAAHGIKTYLFEDLRPTPQVSFAVRELGATVGIMVTASHNPPEYNGYKVYWNDGAQVVAPHDAGIIAEVQKVKGAVAALAKQEALDAGLLEYLDKDFDRKFFDMALDNVVSPQLFQKYGQDLKIVFTPLHGVGAYPVEAVLNRLGVPVIPVPEQREPDGEFPTVKFPNPEEAAALDLGLALAKSRGADILMGTDPDADRLGIAVPDGDNWVLLNGNQLGVLLVDYVFSARKANGSLPETPVFANTVVTTELQNRIAENFGAETYRTLTGFKHIAGIIRSLEQNPGTGTFIMGDEESYGFMFGTRVRDKDAVSAVLLTAEMTLYHRVSGKTVMQRLREIYREYGWYREILVSRYFKGQAGLAIMQGLMEQLRNSPPRKLGGTAVTAVKDYQTGETIDPADASRVKNINLPSSNVLQFIGDDGTVVSARPSGTEPKIKFYASVHTEAGVSDEQAEAALNGKIEKIEATINEWIQSAEQAHQE